MSKIEILRTGTLSAIAAGAAISENAPAENTLVFDGQAKTRGAVTAQTAPYPIPVLAEPQLVLDAFARLRDSYDCSNLSNEAVHKDARSGSGLSRPPMSAHQRRRRKMRFPYRFCWYQFLPGSIIESPVDIRMGRRAAAQIAAPQNRTCGKCRSIHCNVNRRQTCKQGSPPGALAPAGFLFRNC
jgi:hypothetical protein